ncbi:hypothetical protein [Pseudomonas aeruginosa]|uniref:hypothetical protein n=1 Tax=Pseudomonas aeruginosa TaxID=287 RepID=UPI002E295154|nr:hypothetical protein [Pseudomonas aeruginosa]
MNETTPNCTFISRAEAEEHWPVQYSHLISISDDAEDQAVIDETRWKSVSYHHFVDAGFDEVVIEVYGCDFERNYADYFIQSKADDLRERIRTIASVGDPIVVNCQAGRSRSAAVARYIAEHHGYQLDKPTPDANLCVYRMLARDVSLLAVYQAAKAPLQRDTPRRGLLAAIKSLFT